MTNNEKMILFQNRDFGDQISATFEFIKLNIKKIATNYLIFAVPFIIIGSVIYAFGYAKVFENLDIYAGPRSGYNLQIMLGTLIISLGSIFFVLSNYGLLKLYNQSEDPSEITTSQIWNIIKSRIGHYILGAILVGLIVVVGSILLIIPGIYLAVALMFTFVIIVFEDKSAGEAIDRSMKIIRNYWWSTFGYIIVVSIIVGVISYTLLIPITLLSDFSPLNFLTNPESALNMFENFSITNFMIITLLSNLISYFIYSAIVFAIGIRYFTLVEIKEGVQLDKEIESMTTNSENEI